ncbi:hypothetical protein ACS0TY_001980 [Phlomoides rotata]
MIGNRKSQAERILGMLITEKYSSIRTHSAFGSDGFEPVGTGCKPEVSSSLPAAGLLQECVGLRKLHDLMSNLLVLRLLSIGKPESLQCNLNLHLGGVL